MNIGDCAVNCSDIGGAGRMERVLKGGLRSESWNE
jgi:hypothetical protein